METMKGMKRTALCTDITESMIGQSVTVMGWAAKVRDIGQLVFLDVRDRSGLLQVVVEQSDEVLLKKAKGVHIEYVVAVTGKVRARGEGGVNTAMKTGTIEVVAEELRILNASKALPLQLDGNAGDEIRLKYRYLDLRRKELQRNLMVRHQLTKLARDYYDENGFLEIETPMLTKSTPEGARDYLVPSRVHAGAFYALPQSPQQYKQLLMLAGFDKYFQIVRCFRDEDLRAERQPEFTQIDLEMSFVDIDDVISVNERFLQKMFQEMLGIELTLPLPRMRYQEAMERFGSDKPDTRFGLELQDITACVKNSGFKVFADNIAAGGSVRAINGKGLADKLSRKEIDALGEVVKLFKAKGLAWITVKEDGVKSPIAKFLSEEEMQAIFDTLQVETGDAVFIVSDKDEVVFDALGNLRLELARKFDLIDKNRYDLLWVTEFPLLEYSEEEQRYVAKHHPFTSPMDEDLELLDSAPEKVRAKAYDIVINGMEAGGGSIRIYNSELQEKMFRVLGFTKESAWERFGYLMEAFQYGTPPHGGMAYGLDRLVMILTGCDSIRDVIAFPKVQNASELMTNAPSLVDETQLQELHIKLREE
ncbi:MAG: aspartate--tRNA ligase [Clostridia bacterium]|nr:aspartate--tRNA ligase [Clostridia bacterium]